MANSPTLFIFLSLLLISATTQHQQQQESEEEEEDTPISRFQKYLRINTAHPNPNYTAAKNYLFSLAARANLTARVLSCSAPNKPIILITWQGSNPSLPSILLNSHIDSVPAEPHKWTHHPFSAQITPDGRILARGAQDDKCLATQYLDAIANLRRLNFQPIRTLHVSLVPDEEIGGVDGFALFAASDEFRALNVGFALDEGQANPAETGEFRVFYADRCPFELKIYARGMPGHGSRMFDGSAVENLMKSVEIITRFREAQFDVVKAGVAAFSEVISVNLIYLKAGIPSPDGFVMNMQPSEAEAGFDMRVPPNNDLEHLKRRIADEWAPAIRNMSYTIRQKGPTRDIYGRPVITPTNDSNPWWAVFNQAITAVGGKLAKPEILPSTTDARFLRELGIPVLGFSPMTNTPILLHDHNEFLKDTVYLRGIKVYESIIRTLTSFEDKSSQ